MRRTLSFKPTFLAFPLLMAAVLSGCASSDAPAEQTAPSAVSPSAAGSSAPLSTSQDQTVQELGEIGTRQSGNKDVEVTLNNVVANDATMTVNFTMTNNEKSGNKQVKDRFNNGLREAEGAEGTADTFSADGVYVVTEEKKRYLVGRDENGVCACSGNLSNMFVNSGGSMTLSAIFAAPPEQISTVDVFIPTVGTFTDVPLERR